MQTVYLFTVDGSPDNLMKISFHLIQQSFSNPSSCNFHAYIVLNNRFNIVNHFWFIGIPIIRTKLSFYLITALVT